MALPLGTIATGLGKVKIIIAVILGIIVLLLVVYFAGKLSARDKKPKPEKLPLPSDLDTDAGQYWDASPITNALYQDIYEVFGTRNIKAYKDALQLSNAKLAAVHNDWLRRYFDKDEETLREAIQKEWSSPQSYVNAIFPPAMAAGSTEFISIKNQLVARLKQIESQV